MIIMTKDPLDEQAMLLLDGDKTIGRSTFKEISPVCAEITSIHLENMSLGSNMGDGLFRSTLNTIVLRHFPYAIIHKDLDQAGYLARFEFPLDETNHYHIDIEAFFKRPCKG